MCGVAPDRPARALPISQLGRSVGTTRLFCHRLMGQTAKAMRPVDSDEDAKRLLEQLERRDPAPLSWLFDQARLPFAAPAAQRLAKRAQVYLSDLTQLSETIRSLVWVGRRGGEREVLASDELLVSLLHIRDSQTSARAHPAAKLRALLPARQRAAFAAGLAARSAENRWPSGVGAIRGERDTLIFLLEHVQNAAAPTGAHEAPPEEFAAKFERAFSTLHDPLQSNLVALAPLRDRLDTFDREQFDRGLRKLREQGRYVMQTFDGRHGDLTPELEQAAIHENGRTFVYVVRRTP